VAGVEQERGEAAGRTPGVRDLPRSQVVWGCVGTVVAPDLTEGKERGAA
jgi:hypothetical protein